MTDGTSTHDRIIDAALTFFSTKGYDATTTKDIAAAVGMRDASLYKHFASKRAIFDACVDGMDRRMDGLMRQLGLPEGGTPEADATSYHGIDADTLVRLGREIFLFYLEDPYASRYRRMLAMAQYGDLALRDRYRALFMDAAIDYQSAVFARLVRMGDLAGDPQTMALEFYAPIFFLLSRYDDDPDGREEALGLVEGHVRWFTKAFSTKGSDGS
jgi:AcrR family transcriptional regulator